jgi:hypothetical protein
MGYTPAFPNSLFAKPLVNQCIAIIQRDQASAIAIVNPALGPINEFHKGPGLRTAFPWLMLVAAAVSFGEDEHPYTRSQQVGVSLALDVGQFDQEMAQDNAQDYARVLDMIMTTATTADWVTSLPIVQETVPSGVTSPGAVGSVKEVFVQSHEYSLAKTQEIQAPMLRVTLALRFRLEEQ